MHQTLERAKASLLEAARAAQPDATFDPAGYASRLEENLIAGVCRSQFDIDYQAGAGRELAGKMRAAHSSAALVVNTFAPWRAQIARMTVGGVSGFNALRFEATYPTGLGGTPPHLDLEATGACTLLVESKLLEYLTPKPAIFSRAYDTIADSRCDSPWFGLIAELRSHPTAYRYLDAAQLVKHSLGLMRGCPQATLMYLYWEPLNWRAFREFGEHQDEIAEFQESVKAAAVALRAMTYAQLWDEWLLQESDGWIRAHVDRLRQRYEIAI